MKNLKIIQIMVSRQKKKDNSANQTQKTLMNIKIIHLKGYKKSLKMYNKPQNPESNKSD